MISDDKIIELSRELDEVLAALSIKYEISPLSLAAVVNARLMHAVNVYGGAEDYRKLLLGIAGIETERNYPIFSKH